MPKGPCNDQSTPPRRQAPAPWRRFTRTVEDEVEHGIVWADYRHKLSRHLPPRPGASAEAAAADIRLARAHEVDMDAVEDGTPGTPPTWPHWEGTR